MFQSKSFSLAIAVVVLVAAAFTGTSHATQIPIPVTGFTQNMILGASETWPGTLTATMDAGTPVSNNANTWYALGQNSSAPLTGLPSGTVTSLADPTTTLTLQPAGANNTVLIDGSHTSDTLTLTGPGNYSTLSLFGSTGGGNNTIDYTLHFGGGSTQSGTLTFGDWFNGSNAAVVANGRVNNTGYDSVGGGNPRIYQVNVPFTFTNGLQLLSVTLTQDPTTGGGHTAIFALSGAHGAPEPSTFVLGGLGMVGLVVAARRRRRA